MASLNKVFLLGNLTRDPDLRALPSGTAVCEFGIAVNRRYTSGNGQEIEEPCFVDIVVWGRSAESCRQFLEKGEQVLIEGRLQRDQWEDRNGGGKRSRLRVVAEQVQFLSRRPGGDGGPQGGSYNPGYDAGAYGQQQRSYQPRQPQGGMPRAPQQSQGAMPRAPQPEMPPMPNGAFNPDEGMEDDIPF